MRLIIIILLYSFFSYGQAFVSEKNMWFDSYGLRHTFSQDSFLVDSKYYRKELISDQEFGNNFQNSDRYYRQQGQIVYYKPQTLNPERLLYNFSLIKGDTFYLKSSSFNPFFMTVLKVDSVILLDGSPRKRIKVLCDKSSRVTFDWIEGLGGVIQTDSPCVLDGGGAGMTCFYTNNQHIFKTYELWLKDENCFFKTATKEIQNDQIEIFPNPANDYLNLHLKEVQISNGYLMIYDALGKSWKKSVITDGENKIDLISLPYGIYFYNIVSDNFISKAGKIIKN
jgi:hypothetical protein